MKRIFTFFFIFLFLSACEESEDPAPVTGEYVVSGEIAADPLVMYTGGGRITSSGLIAEFLGRRNAEWWRGIDTSLSLTSNLLSIDFRDGNGATIRTSIDTVEVEAGRSLGSNLVFLAVDSTRSLSYSSDSRCDFLRERMMFVNPDAVCVPVSPMTGYTEMCKFRMPYPVIVRNGRLSVPLATFFVFSGTKHSYCSFMTASSWNLFNSGISHLLLEGDTVVVRTGALPLRKK